MTLLPIALALSLTGPTAAPSRTATVLAAAAEPPRAKDARRWIGLCVQIDAPGSRVSAARIAATSGDAAWDAQMAREVLGMQTPVPLTVKRGAWMSLWISDSTGEPGAAAADPAQAQPGLDCSKQAADTIRRPAGA